MGQNNGIAEGIISQGHFLRQKKRIGAQKKRELNFVDSNVLAM
jgi:hypothetical protein